MKHKAAVVAAMVFQIAAITYGAGFTTDGYRIMNPNGKEFVPIGANVNAFNYGSWAYGILKEDQYDKWINCWKFNFMRACFNLKDSYWKETKTSDGVYGHGATREAEAWAAFDALVKKYTVKGVVVMFEAHDWTGTYPTGTDLTMLKKFWTDLATRYKTNPYVWINLWNEPGWENPVSPLYKTQAQELIKAIRDDAGTQNMIVVDGSACAQEAYSWSDKPISTQASGILTYGDSLISFNSKKYANICFSFHMYDQWGRHQTDVYHDVKMKDYLTRIRAKNFPILIGEVGVTDRDWTAKDQTGKLAYEIALRQFNVGICAWHWDPKDGHRLVDETGYAGWQITSCIDPTNLSPWLGAFLWKATHTDGFGLNATTTISSGTSPKAILKSSVQPQIMAILGNDKVAGNVQLFDINGKKHTMGDAHSRKSSRLFVVRNVTVRQGD